jgi:Transposase
MESTGVYWKAVRNILEGQFEILLVNAQHIQAVPGRKTDQKDSEWIADLLQHGLLLKVFADLNHYAATMHLLGRTTILTLTGDRGTGETYWMPYQLTIAMVKTGA